MHTWNLKNIKYAVWAIILLLVWQSPVRAQAADRLQPVGDVVTVVIDPGHGGKNVGTESGHTIEKEMTLITAQAMYDELTQFDGIQVYMTRTTDKGLELVERAEYAKSVDADFLFSIHYNASEFHTMYGTEVWISCEAPYNAYGYQFGYEHLESFREMGLFVRGVKCRRSTEHSHDYYGVIREAVAREIPTAIIEHCYVDEERDAEFVENAEDYKAFGRADAHSVARYFGLKSKKLGIDYSEAASALQPASVDEIVQSTEQDLTAPDICDISILECDYDTGALSLSISATDYDSPLIYYAYSIDNGQNWSRLEAWPETDTLTGEYPDTFRLNLTIPGGRRPSIKVRAYNITDVYKESNTLYFDQTFTKREDGSTDLNPSVEGVEKKAETPATQPLEHKHESIGTTTFQPVSAEPEETADAVNILTFLKFCLALVIVLFFIVLTTQIVNYNRRKKRRRR